MPDYTSDDYAAFLVFAGPPPSVARVNYRNGAAGKTDLQTRLDYVGKCDEFCQQYFGAPPRTGGTVKLHVTEEWVEFYSAFTKWYAIRQEMSLDSDLDTMTYQVLRDIDCL